MKRYSSIDAMRAVAAFLIICIHEPMPGLLGEIVVPLARVAVPFFLLTTGFFLWDSDNGKLECKIIKQIKSMFIIMILSNILYFTYEILKNIINGDSIVKYITDTLSIKTLIKCLIFNESPFGYHLWYLSAVLYSLCLFYFINKYNLFKIANLCVPILLIVDLILGKYSLLLLGFEPPFIAVRNFLFVGVPYLLIGNYIRKIKENNSIKVSNALILIGIIVFSFTTLMEKYLLVINHVNSLRDHYLSTTLLSVCIFIYLINNPHMFQSNSLVIIGRKHSLNVYILHPIIIGALGVVDSKLNFSQNFLYQYSVSILIFILSIIASLTLIKFIALIEKSKFSNFIIKDKDVSF